MISDASCFMDCGIKEVHLPEHCLKTKQAEKKEESKVKKTRTQPCTGVPFKVAGQKDTEWLFQGILAAGSCLATDVYGDRPEDDYVREKNVHWKREFVFAVTAILGEKRLAFMLTLSELGSCWIVCPGCENCDEEMEFNYFDFSGRIEKAEVPVDKWDGENLADVKQWLFNLFALLDDTEGMERLCHYFGTYTCPECGERTSVFTGMEGYYLS